MNNERNNTTAGGIGFCGLLAVAFIVLKLTGVINWSWDAPHTGARLETPDEDQQVEVQIRGRTEDGRAFASNIMTAPLSRILKDGVI